jgi:hypothetical protein
MTYRFRPRMPVLPSAVVAVALIAVAMGALAFGVRPSRTAPGTSAAPAAASPAASASGATEEHADAERGGGHVDDPSDEVAEEAEATAERIAAYQAALKNGTAGQQRPAGSTAAKGWFGEQAYDTIADDWEPAIAADPHASYVYALATRYGVPKPCADCPVPYIVIKVSADNGATWTNSVPVCACKGGKGQFDPIIEVAPNTGDVFVLFLGGGGNGFNVFFTKSTDHGKTWSTPVPTWGNVSWNDKPVIAVSDDGNDVYVSFNGPTVGDPWIAQSHDGGKTWTQTKEIDSKQYIYAFDGDVAPDGTVYFAESALQYSGSTKVVGTIDHHVFVSTDRGKTFIDHVVATVQVGMPCTSTGCGPDFYVGHDALTVDAAGNVGVAFDGAQVYQGPQTIQYRRSTDRGESWSTPITLSKSTEMSTTPAMEAGASGDIRAWWMETNGLNTRAWNVWYRSSADGGVTWTTAVKLSDATGGAAYKTADGFNEVYGDYGELAITNTGKSIAIWGEGISWFGPGGIWFNRER